ncbi:MAG: hypothetical protein QXU98_14450 [Candidatus Parvarchaeota archaeon]|uniref:hypothetical protein n=1 Tax=Metallosphaera sp. TaxID=2020860 RepID=UPI0031773B35
MDEGEEVREKIESGDILLSSEEGYGEIIMAKKPKYQVMEYWMKICTLNEKEYAGELNWLICWIR